MSEPLIIYRLQIIEVFKGNAASDDIIEFIQPLRYAEWESLILLTVGEEYVLFLSEFRHTLSPFQTAYRFPFPNEIARDLPFDTQLESVPPLSNREILPPFALPLTVGDLIRLSDGELGVYNCTTGEVNNLDENIDNIAETSNYNSYSGERILPYEETTEDRMFITLTVGFVILAAAFVSRKLAKKSKLR